VTEARKGDALASLAHLRENLAAADLELSAHVIVELDRIVAPTA
jgi:hypothetical protein